jgi:diguanylate cyclase (GGDEF)-like protein
MSSDEPRRLRLSGSTGVWALTVVVAAGAALATLLVAGHDALRAPIGTPWWMLAVAFAASEIFVIHFQFRQEQFTFSLMELPLVLGLFFASPLGLIVGRLVGGGLALRVHRRQARMKLLFNMATHALETATAILLFRGLLGAAEGRDARAMLAGFVAVILSGLLATVCIAGAIACYEGIPEVRILRRLVAANFVVSVTNSSLALVTVAVLWVSRGAGWLLSIVAAILYLGYRSYARLQQKHDDLELLYDFTRRTGRALGVDTAMRELLGQVRAVLRADTAELVVQGASPDDPYLRTILREGRDVEITEFEQDALWRRMAERGSSLLVAAPVRDAALRDELAAHGVHDALVAPLRRVDGEVIGMMLAGDRLGEQRTFSSEDLKLFEALANHAGVSLENRHLIDRLRNEAADKEYQSLHDALTGLPNRLLFQRRVGEAIHTNRSSKVAVLLLDLDRFKEVNDTLGHHNGDLLLQEVGDRLRRTLRAGDTVARLGGDEFGVLLPDLAGGEAAVAAASGVRAALQRPFHVGELSLDVGASIGIALWPDHGDDATLLYQRADVAMYAAKESQRGVEVYDPARDTYSLERLTLVGELRTAIDRGDLAVHYQPKADIVTGEIVGVEALVRWYHPRHGPIAPEEIIRIAEQTGIIRPLTLWVLGQALRQCRAWRREGRVFDVAVNLSFRNIVDAELPNDVRRLLDEVGLPPSALTFEMTESSIMIDPMRTIGLLNRLRQMGIGLAIDDFGTGYASFSHLRRLPVDEIKIDKSFVGHLSSDDSDAVIVKTIVDLGHNLGLRVVAEGVEDRASYDILAAHGCDVAQGYLLTPALPADELDHWLDARAQAMAGAKATAEPPSAELGDVVRLRPRQA